VSDNQHQSPVGGKPSLSLIVLKEFYRLLLLALSVFFLYYLVANSNIFVMEDTSKEITIKIILLIVGILIAAFITKLLDVFLWESFQEKKKIARIPNLLKQGVNVMVYMAALFIVLKLVFQVSIGGLLTATGVLGVVVGLALKEIISDIFAGIIISLDRTVKIGDWVKLELRANSEKVGCIADMNWRSVHLVTAENILVIVPNSLISNSLISNLSRPDHNKEMELTINFDFEVSSDRVIRVIGAALFQTKEILQDPEPKVRIGKVSHLGVEYKVKYWIDVSSIGPGKARGAVLKNVMHNLSQAGMTMSYPKSDVYNAAMPARNLDIRKDRFELLKRVDLFNSLSQEEIAILASDLKEMDVKKGQFIIRIGEPGSSMYILVEGLLNVMIIDPKDHTEMNVAQVIPGSFFGEMSLLTGEPRSASVWGVCDSVLFEIPKASITELLAHNPEIAETFSHKIMEMKLKNEYVSEHRHDADREERKDKLKTGILAKIKNFFNLSG
jgi:small-conductance mechanosensitive channel